jgi:hypothetical protein
MDSDVPSANVSSVEEVKPLQTWPRHDTLDPIEINERIESFELSLAKTLTDMQELIPLANNDREVPIL